MIVPMLLERSDMAFVHADKPPLFESKVTLKLSNIFSINARSSVPAQ